MPLQITHQGDVAVVMPEGLLTGGDETNQLETELRALVQHGHRKIVLDLERTWLITSHGLGVLISVHAHAANNGGAMHLCNLEPKIRNVLKTMRLLDVLHVFDSRDAALAAFPKPSG